MDGVEGIMHSEDFPLGASGGADAPMLAYA